MKTLSIKIDPELERALVLASEREDLSKSEVMRRALASYLSQRTTATSTPPALALVGDLAGCFSGGPADLSSNPRHLDDFGRR